MNPNNLINKTELQDTKPGIYMIFNVENHMIYIGQAKNPSYRKREHFYDFANDRHGNPYMSAVYKKYGKDIFSFVMLENCPEEFLTEREGYYVGLVPKEQRYNIKPVKGTIMLEETRQKISNKMKGVKKNYVSGKLGWKTPDEVRKKMSEASKGRPMTKACTEAKLKAIKGKPSPLLGRKASDEVRKKMSESRKAYLLAHPIEKKVMVKTGHTNCLCHHGPNKVGSRPRTEEEKKRISETLKKRYADAKNKS